MSTCLSRVFTYGSYVTGMAALRQLYESVLDTEHAAAGFTRASGYIWHGTT